MTIAHDGFSNPEFEFADRIRKIRRDVAHLTQQEMADELDVSQKVYSAWESGRNHPTNIVAVAKRIAIRWPGISPSWVLGIDDFHPPSPPPGASESKPTDSLGPDGGAAPILPLRPTG